MRNDPFGHSNVRHRLILENGDAFPDSDWPCKDHPLPLLVTTTTTTTTTTAAAAAGGGGGNVPNNVTSLLRTMTSCRFPVTRDSGQSCRQAVVGKAGMGPRGFVVYGSLSPSRSTLSFSLLPCLEPLSLGSHHHHHD